MKTPKKKADRTDVPYDRGSEKALLSLIFRHGLNELIEALDPADFFDPWHHWIFRELRLMWEAGVPMDCGAAAARWFASAGCKVRATEAGITETPAYVTAYTFKEDFVSLAHKDWLVTQLRKQRMRRFLLQVAEAIPKWDAESPDDPIATLKKMQDAHDRAWARCAQVFPEEMIACDE